MNKSSLQKALEIVKPGLSKSDTIEQATSFAFLDGKVVTYNDEISISHPVEGLDIEGAIKADALYGLLSKIKNEEVELSVSENENEILIKSGKTKAGIAMQAKVVLPLEEVSSKGKFKKLPENFCTLILMATGACSTNSGQPILNCVNVDGDSIQASDGYKVINAKLVSKMPCKTFLIPAASALTVVKLKPTKVSEGEGWIHFKNEEGTEISCRILEEEFPKITHLLKMEGVDVSFPANLAEIIDRANIFAKRDSAQEESITITLANKSLKVSSDSEYGWFEESVKTKFAGDPVEFVITPYLLKGILSQTTDCILGNDRLKFTGEDWVYVTALK